MNNIFTLIIVDCKVKDYILFSYFLQPVDSKDLSTITMDESMFGKKKIKF